MLLLRHCKNGFFISGMIGIIAPSVFIIIKHFIFGHPISSSYSVEGPRTLVLTDKLIVIAFSFILIAISRIKLFSLKTHRNLFIAFTLICSFSMLSDDILNRDINFLSGYQIILFIIAAFCIPFKPHQILVLGIAMILMLYPGIYVWPLVYGISDLNFAPNQIIHYSMTVLIIVGLSSFHYKSRHTTYSLRKKNEEIESELILTDESEGDENIDDNSIDNPGSKKINREKEILMGDVISVSELNVQSVDEKFIDEVKQVIEKHLGDSNFGVEWLAYEVSISPRQLQRRLKSYIGITAGALIRVMRMQRAAQLMRQKAGNVSEIAYQTGFNDPVYFSRLFKKMYDMNPSDFIREHDSV
jgi:AraC-like DNA-binding protein